MEKERLAKWQEDKKNLENETSAEWQEDKNTMEKARSNGNPWIKLEGSCRGVKKVGRNRM